MSALLSLFPAAGAPAVWRADELAHPSGAVLATGYALLDSQLPGGGWSMGSMVEILQAQAGQNEWRLLLPALRRSAAGPVVLVGAPHVPFGPGLAAQGFDAQRLLCVDVQAPAARLWATEQALRCSAVFIVLVWLPQVRAEPLRRLQMAAHEHGKLLFVMRPAQARDESSPAVLRLLVASPTTTDEPVPLDALCLQVLKRRGPPLLQALALPARSGRLGALLALKEQGETGRHDIGRRDALDRLAAAAR
ncbi:translesion DNA synthesis-associated protein ImuA [Rhodoferax sp.]|uniref:translesion DNA synthesis-associated protein ImuA n=1 Tax=Rhodoferax sp. TaxID=50421 RepID=UPI001ED13EDC|nr:translesion DNA synthesis-associated protein ImuA [Rhodoferax sp.]MBT9505945.1 translesion DNA synthesis-associated protein ImuA [Rhodoferax sp.]